MRASNSLHHAFLAVLLLLSLAHVTFAQGNRQNPPAPNPPSNNQPNNNNNNQQTTDGGDSTTAAATSAPSSAASSAATSAPASSPSPTSAPAQTTAGATSLFRLTSAPTLAGAGIPTIIIPDTSKAPFMQKSSLPEGTVFISVGAILGFAGAAVLAWRGMVAWSLHRSVKRAAKAHTFSDTKSGRGPGRLHKGAAAMSNLSLDRLHVPMGSKAHKHLSTASGPPGSRGAHSASASSLFFSPTAGAGSNSVNGRSSTYLPSGYYASGASATANGAQMTHIGVPPGPLTTGPAAAGYTRTRSLGPSPPGSPVVGPMRGGYDRPPGSRGNESVGRSSVAGNVGAWAQSSSTLNLNAPPQQGRTPSAYLEDLFENHGTGPRERY